MNDTDSAAGAGGQSPWVLRCEGLGKVFVQGDQRIEVISGLDLSVRRGECVAIIGQSGTGKSTLLQILGGLDQPSTGRVSIAGQPLERLNDAARGRLRNRLLGFIYQFHHLLPEFSALENVAMPLLIRGLRPAAARARATAMLDKVGLAPRLDHKPGELSGGERQRAAVARALITDPACVLADEPTGNLDPYNAAQVFELMLDLNRSLATSLVVVTHDHVLAARMDTVWLLEGGVLRRQDGARLGQVLAD